MLGPRRNSAMIQKKQQEKQDIEVPNKAHTLVITDKLGVAVMTKEIKDDEIHQGARVNGTNMVDGAPSPAPDISSTISKSEGDPVEKLKPKPPPRLAPQGIQAFTVCRQYDETGISGEGIVIEGVVLATGQCIVHWLYPPPRGGIAIFDSLSDFIKVHIEPHPTNRSIITYDDGVQEEYGG